MSFQIYSGNLAIDLRPFPDLQELSLNSAGYNLSKMKVPASVRRFRLRGVNVKGLEQFLNQSRDLNELSLSNASLSHLEFLPHSTSLISLRVVN